VSKTAAHLRPPASPARPPEGVAAGAADELAPAASGLKLTFQPGAAPAAVLTTLQRLLGPGHAALPAELPAGPPYVKLSFESPGAAAAARLALLEEPLFKAVTLCAARAAPAAPPSGEASRSSTPCPEGGGGAARLLKASYALPAGVVAFEEGIVRAALRACPGLGGDFAFAHAGACAFLTFPCAAWASAAKGALERGLGAGSEWGLLRGVAARGGLPPPAAFLVRAPLADGGADGPAVAAAVAAAGVAAPAAALRYDVRGFAALTVATLEEAVAARAALQGSAFFGEGVVVLALESETPPPLEGGAEGGGGGGGGDGDGGGGGGGGGGAGAVPSGLPPRPPPSPPRRAADDALPSLPHASVLIGSPDVPLARLEALLRSAAAANPLADAACHFLPPLLHNESTGAVIARFEKEGAAEACARALAATAEGARMAVSVLPPAPAPRPRAASSADASRAASPARRPRAFAPLRASPAADAAALASRLGALRLAPGGGGDADTPPSGDADTPPSGNEAPLTASAEPEAPRAVRSGSSPLEAPPPAPLPPALRATAAAALGAAIATTVLTPAFAAHAPALIAAARREGAPAAAGATALAAPLPLALAAAADLLFGSPPGRVSAELFTALASACGGCPLEALSAHAAAVAAFAASDEGAVAVREWLAAHGAPAVALLPSGALLACAAADAAAGGAPPPAAPLPFLPAQLRPPGAPAPATATFTLLQYNVMGLHLEQPGRRGWATWGNRRATLLTHIAASVPDILCLQELASRAAEPLAGAPPGAAGAAASARALAAFSTDAVAWLFGALARLGYRGAYRRNAGGGAEGGHVNGEALLWRGAAFAEEARCAVDYRDAAARAEPRAGVEYERVRAKGAKGLLHATLVHRATGARLLAATTHLSVSVADRARQRAEVQLCLDLLREEAASKSAHVVLAGDFNVMPGDEAYAMLVGRGVDFSLPAGTGHVGGAAAEEAGGGGGGAWGFRSAYATAMGGEEPPITTLVSHPWARGDDAAGGGGSGGGGAGGGGEEGGGAAAAAAGHPEVQFAGTLDYIFFRPAEGGGSLRLVSVDELPTAAAVLAETQGKGLPCRRWPSDHLPLTATFSLD
jgi:mRNA deadenylase 3'-5' endonuclease subunit Ccr4